MKTSHTISEHNTYKTFVHPPQKHHSERHNVRSRYKLTSADKNNITRTTKITTQVNNRNTKLTNPKEVEKPKPCEKPFCKTCQHFVSSESFKSTVTQQSFRIRHPFTCNSSNIILSNHLFQMW